MSKIGYLILVWVFTIIAYVGLAATMPTLREITATAVVELEASCDNISNFPGTLGMVESFPVYAWFIPGLIAIIITVIILKVDNFEGIITNRWRR
jgi:hypothetical protein